jgi:hypothetical protein
MQLQIRMARARRAPSLVLLAFGAIGGARAAGPEEKLVAPPYPGAVRLSPAKLALSVPAGFAVKDSHEKVVSFYVPKHARQPHEGEGRRSGDGTLPLIVQDAGQVAKMIVARNGDYTAARATEVIVDWKPAALAGTGPESQFFRRLEEQAKKHPGHDGELADLKKKYDWLKIAFFDEGKFSSLLKRCSEAAGDPAMSGILGDPKARKELEAQVKMLMAEGRSKEAVDLQMKAMGSMAGDPKKAKADNFKLWGQCVDELASFAYLTKITIDRDVSQWDVTWGH